MKKKHTQRFPHINIKLEKAIEEHGTECRLVKTKTVLKTKHTQAHAHTQKITNKEIIYECNKN